MKKPTLKVVKKSTRTDKEVQDDQLRIVVTNHENVMGFLSDVADQASVETNTPAEVVKAAHLIRLFLKNRVDAVKRQNPGVFNASKS